MNRTSRVSAGKDAGRGPGQDVSSAHAPAQDQVDEVVGPKGKHDRDRQLSGLALGFLGMAAGRPILT